MLNEDDLHLIKEALREFMHGDGEEFDEPSDPRTKAFRSDDLEDLSDQINAWAEETDSYIISISMLNTIVNYEAIVIYEPDLVSESD